MKKTLAAIVMIGLFIALAFSLLPMSTPIKGLFGKDNTSLRDIDTGMSAMGNITGVNSVAHNSVCTDSQGRALSELGTRISVMAVNVTDRSSGQITAVSGSTFTVTLAGGKNNVWAVGDQFLILAGEYGIRVLEQLKFKEE
jgi:hypothetical protein